MAEVKTLNQPNLPSNSKKSKTAQEKTENRIKPVVKKGDVVRKKKSTGRKFIDSFFGEDISNVKDYLIFDIMIPSLKDGIIDAVTNGLTMLLTGNRGGSKVTGRVRNVSGGTNYSKIYTLNGTSRNERPFNKARDSRYAMTNGMEDEIILQSRAEAEEVLEVLICRVEDYGSATVGDLYDALGETSSPTDRKWGWFDLSSARVVRVTDGYLIRLPRCEYL
jgi:hypothetical protein